MTVNVIRLTVTEIEPQVITLPGPAVKLEITGPQGPAGPAGPAGSVASPTRSALKALATSAGTSLLTEAGYEGVFRWDAAVAVAQTNPFITGIRVYELR